jgi:RNA polymerase sigma-70 factor (ECF subfamily)
MDVLTAESDEELMARVAARDAAALESLYDRYSPAVLGLLTRILEDRSAAEELVQETFWRVWDKSESFDPAKGSFGGWLFSIARRQALDALRRRKLRPQVARTEAEAAVMETRSDSAPPVDEAVIESIEAHRVRTAVGGLPAEQQQVIRLAYFQGLTRQQIAAATNQPIGTVHTRARLGLQRLRTLLGESGGG